MSQVPVSEKIEIYIPRLDEGTSVVRPTQAEIVGPGEYLVRPTPDYDPDDEHWEFLPGSVVQCVPKHVDEGEILVARKRLR